MPPWLLQALQQLGLSQGGPMTGSSGVSPLPPTSTPMSPGGLPGQLGSAMGNLPTVPGGAGGPQAPVLSQAAQQALAQSQSQAGAAPPGLFGGGAQGGGMFGPLAAAAGLLQASGPSPVPVGLGQAAGAGLQGYMQGRMQDVQQMQQDRIQQIHQRIAEMLAQRAQQTPGAVMAPPTTPVPGAPQNPMVGSGGIPRPTPPAPFSGVPLPTGMSSGTQPPQAPGGQMPFGGGMQRPGFLQSQLGQRRFGFGA